MAKRADKIRSKTKPTGGNKPRGRNRGATKDTYTGRGGQLAVMAELLLLKCNVAIPEVDEGTDVFAFIERKPEVAHLPVKTARAKRYRREAGYSAQFSIPVKELRGPSALPAIYYVLAARVDGAWADFIVIARDDVADLYWDGPGANAADNFAFTVQFRPEKALLGEKDLTPFRNAWARLPPFMEAITVASSYSDVELEEVHDESLDPGVPPTGKPPTG